MKPIPVIAAGSEDYITLVFPTIPHDEYGNYMTGWDRYAGHGAISIGWLNAHDRVDELLACEELHRYLRLYHEGTDDEYVIVQYAEQSHHDERREEAKKWRILVENN